MVCRFTGLQAIILLNVVFDPMTAYKLEFWPVYIRFHMLVIHNIQTQVKSTVHGDPCLLCNKIEALVMFMNLTH